jgi:hypothetical protein
VRLVRFFSEDVPVPRWCVYGGLAAAILNLVHWLVT